jgi:hypothetical protein
LIVGRCGAVAALQFALLFGDYVAVVVRVGCYSSLFAVCWWVPLGALLLVRFTFVTRCRYRVLRCCERVVAFWLPLRCVVLLPVVIVVTLPCCELPLLITLITIAVCCCVVPAIGAV